MLRISKEEDLFVYEKSEPDPRFAGRWQKIGKRPQNAAGKDIEYTISQALKRIADTKDKSGRSKVNPKYLVLQKDGAIPRDRFRFWTRDLLLDNDSGEARRMQFRTVNGRELLLIENGNFSEEPVGPEWHSGFTIPAFQDHDIQIADDFAVLYGTSPMRRVRMFAPPFFLKSATAPTFPTTTQ